MPNKYQLKLSCDHKTKSEHLEKQPYLRGKDGSVVISVHVVPRAKRSKIAGIYGESLKISLAAPPVDGKANQELLDFLADELGMAKSHFAIGRGQASREKEVVIQASLAEIKEKLYKLLT